MSTLNGKLVLLDETDRLRAEQLPRLVYPSFGAFPSAGIEGRTAYDQETGDWWLDDGDDWIHKQSTARVVLGAAASETALNYPPSGPGDTLILAASLTEVSVPDVFSRVASGSGHAIRCAFGGLYRVTAVVSSPNTSPAVVISGAAGGASLKAADWVLVATPSMQSRVAANGDIKILASAVQGSGSAAKVEGLVVERVAP